MPDTITDPKKYRRGWTGGLPETECGFGSKLSQTVIQREFIPWVATQYNCKSVSDIGAGDLNWIQSIDWDVEYSAFDLVPRHPQVSEFDLCNEVPPKSDLLMVLWVLNHLTEEQARAAMRNIWASGSKYLMFTYEPRQWGFTDIPPLESVVIRRRGKDDPRGDVEIRFIKINDYSLDDLLG